MTQEHVRIIVNHLSKDDSFLARNNEEYIIAVMNNGDRLKGLIGYLSFSYGLLRLCDAGNMSDAAQPFAKWYCVPAEEICYIQSTVAIPCDGSFMPEEKNNYDLT